MRKSSSLLLVTFFVLIFYGIFSTLKNTDVSMAQTSDEKYLKQIERDKNIPKIAIEKAYEEAKIIQDNLMAKISLKKPIFKLKASHSYHLIASNPGDLGATNDQVIWRTRTSELRIDIRIGIKKEDELELFHKSLSGISMGDFFDVKNIGDEAILVKNIFANKINTSVGLHFIKGRAQVSVYLKNFKQTTEKNEKELMEIVRLVEPLIIVRPNFDDGF